MPSHQLAIATVLQEVILLDAGADVEACEEWSDVDDVRRVKVEPGILRIRAARDGVVDATLAVADVDPGYEDADWDHIVECTLKLPIGRLQVFEPSGGSAYDTELVPGIYSARVLFAGLDGGYVREQPWRDTYCLQLWPGEQADVRIVKSWKPT